MTNKIYVMIGKKRTLFTYLKLYSMMKKNKFESVKVIQH